MKDEKKVITPEEKSAPLTDEQMKNVAGGGDRTKTCPNCGKEFSSIEYIEHSINCKLTGGGLNNTIELTLYSVVN